MTIRLYNNTSDARVLNKNITKIGSDITCNPTDECTVEDPSSKLLIDNSFISANYLFVVEWNRYYFIKGRTILNGQHMLVDCHIDVLMSFRNAILSSQIIAERSSSEVDEYIEDNVVHDRKTIQQKFRRMETTPFSLTTNCYVLHLAGK